MRATSEVKATFSISPAIQFMSLSIGLVGLLGMGLTASGLAVNIEDSKAAELPPTTPWSPNEPAWFAISDSPAVAVRDLAARTPKWTSPHVRRAFVVGLGSQLITGAHWVFDMWVDHQQKFRLWRSEVSSSTNLHWANVLVPQLQTLALTTYRWTGKARFHMTGYVGTAELVIEFVAEVVAESGKCFIKEMIEFPTATLDNAEIPITSWSFDKAQSA
ncbi:hypothetical protein E4U53_004093 [Claviceps sorghi]|nr:hypothetical protein E4U53_004093 [Claviceps sorghi]